MSGHGEFGGQKFAGRAAALLCAIVLMGAVPCAADEAAAETVRAREQAFADTLAERDFEAFRSFLSDEAVFWSEMGADRGKGAVAARWRPYFEGPEAPFSWHPEQVEVLASGTLAFSSGPVFDAYGRRSASFHSVWRLEDDGQWRIVFDKGHRWCPPQH